MAGQVKFLSRQHNPLLSQHQGAGGKIQVSLRQPHPVQRPGPFRGASQHRLYPGEHFQQTERLHHIIVRSQLQPAHLVRFRPLGGQHQNGNGSPVFPDEPEQVKTACPGQNHIQQRQVVILRVDHVQGIIAVLDGQHVVTGHRQSVRKPVSDGVIVFYDQNAVAVHGKTSIGNEVRNKSFFSRSIPAGPPEDRRPARRTHYCSLFIGEFSYGTFSSTKENFFLPACRPHGLDDGVVQRIRLASAGSALLRFPFVQPRIPLPAHLGNFLLQPGPVPPPSPSRAASTSFALFPFNSSGRIPVLPNSSTAREPCSS